MLDIVNLKRRIFGKTASNIELSNQKTADGLRIERTFTSDQVIIDGKPISEDIPTGRFSLSEILEQLARREGQGAYVFSPEKAKARSLEELAESEIWLSAKGRDDPLPLLLYELAPGMYYVYEKQHTQEEPDRKGPVKIYGSDPAFMPEDPNRHYSYIPTGVIIRRVPEHILGLGILGRAFVYQNYIEILDKLEGHDFIEVLTHEILHIQNPEYSETKIRTATQNYMPNARYQ